MKLLLALAIGTVALVYASVGHAGATGYIAVMTLCGLAPQVIRPTALVLNVVVAAIATIQFGRAGYFQRRLFLPLAAASVPAAAIGGAIDLPTAWFEIVLGSVLLWSAIRLFREAREGSAGEAVAGEEASVAGPITVSLLAALGGGIGLLSGLTGVGGGVFLTPALLALHAAPVRQVAAVSAPFILVNSLAGLAGGLASGRGGASIDVGLIVAAIVGGAVGSQLGAFRLPARALRILVAVVLVVAGLKLLMNEVLEHSQTSKEASPGSGGHERSGDRSSFAGTSGGYFSSR